MTYPGLDSRRERHDVAFQFHLIRMGLTYLQQQETKEPEVLACIREYRAQRRATIHAQLGSMRDLLHLLFD